MDLKVFRDFTRANPQLVPYLDRLIGPPVMDEGRDHKDMPRETWIERYVDGVKLLPFDVIGLNSRSVGLWNEPERTAYTIFYHIEDGDASEQISYLRDVSPSMTLREALGIALGHHQERLAQSEKRRLVVDVIARQTIIIKPGRPYYHEDIQLFEVPPNGDLVAGIKPVITDTLPVLL